MSEPEFDKAETAVMRAAAAKLRQSHRMTNAEASFVADWLMAEAQLQEQTPPFIALLNAVTESEKGESCRLSLHTNEDGSIALNMDSSAPAIRLAHKIMSRRSR